MVMGLLVVLIFVLGPGLSSFQRIEVERDGARATKARLEAAMARFNQRCAGAGERVTRTAEQIDGLVIMNTRPEALSHSDQFLMDDPYGRNCVGGDDCIASYLFDYRMVQSGAGLEPSTPRVYQFVDVVDAAGQRYRYTKDSPNAPLMRSPTSESAPRYGVLWTDVSSREDRDDWIAGGSIRVVDLLTQEVIAERIGYLIDVGQGARGGGRSPWNWARSNGPVCPSVGDHNVTFVAKVLQPRGSKQ
ncbi:MAG: hypothetical protein ABI699_10670 [Caldimonas sp.]